ncbi:hypothetical protein D9615_010241 [Tricholomella constricta]|uniref:HMG box domain-containing protein n=1 Tax=Tricholomella constricta TaxID=117010 RepID=A0A8H5LU67_9AGAR|nr:hypothetical protein D9615_010241 [Tricholomella constricta]
MAEKQEKVRRPPNSFILYRAQMIGELRSQSDGTTRSKALSSKDIAQRWRNEEPQVKQYFANRAKKTREEHKENHPDYKYRPERKKDRDKKAKIQRPKGDLSSKQGTNAFQTSPLRCNSGESFQIDHFEQYQLPYGQPTFDLCQVDGASERSSPPVQLQTVSRPEWHEQSSTGFQQSAPDYSDQPSQEAAPAVLIGHTPQSLYSTLLQRSSEVFCSHPSEDLGGISTLPSQKGFYRDLWSSLLSRANPQEIYNLASIYGLVSGEHYTYAQQEADSSEWNQQWTDSLHSEAMHDAASGTFPDWLQETDFGDWNTDYYGQC